MICDTSLLLLSKNPYLWPGLQTQTCLHTDAAGICDGGSGQPQGGLESSDPPSALADRNREVLWGYELLEDLPLPQPRALAAGALAPSLTSLLLQSLACLSIFIVRPPPTHTHKSYLAVGNQAWKSPQRGGTAMAGGGQVSGRLFRERSWVKGGKENIDVSTDVYRFLVILLWQKQIT